MLHTRKPFFLEKLDDTKVLAEGCRIPLLSLYVMTLLIHVKHMGLGEFSIEELDNVKTFTLSDFVIGALENAGIARLRD